MAKFLLLNREEEYVQTLKNVTVAKGNEIINGEDTLDLTIFDTEIEKNYRILLQDSYGKWHEYIVQEIEESHTDKGIRKKVYCESSIYETIGDFVEDRRFNNTTALMALAGVLQHTRWKVGRVDNLGTESYSPYRVDAKTAIQTIAKTWKGELQTRIEVSGNKITGRYIDLLKKIGNDTGKRFSWTKDIQQIKRTVVRDDVITALYGFGKGEEVGEGFGRRLDFAEINDGKMYVENNEAKEQFGRLDSNGNKVHIFGKVEFDDETDKLELKEKTEAELEVFSKPLLSYSADVLDLKQFGYEHEGYELGDTVLIIDKEFKPELRVLARIIEKETDYLEESNSNVTLGNFIPTSTSEDLKNERYINNFRDKSGVWDRADYISKDGKFFIDDLLDQLNAKANATGGYFYYTEGEGTITTDRPIDENPTMAVEIKGGSIRIADSKLPDGSWDWRTAMTGDGITLDAVNTGVLTTGRILSSIDGSYWDLENGVMDLKGGKLTGNRLEMNLDIGKVTSTGVDGKLVVYENGEVTTTSGTKTGKTNALGVSIDDSSNGQRTRLFSDGLEFQWYSIIRQILQNSEGLTIKPITGSGNRLNSSLHLVTGPGNDKVAYLQFGIPDQENGDARIQLARKILSIRHPNEGELIISDYNFDGSKGLTRSGTFRTNPVDGDYLEMVGKEIKTAREGNNNIFLTPSGNGGVRVGSPTSSELYPITALSFVEGSNRDSKTNIKPFEEKALNIVNDLVVTEYNLKVELERGINQRKIGFIAEDSPAISAKQSGSDKLGVDHYKMTAIAIKALQELDKENTILKQELSDLKNVLKEKGLI